MSKPSKSWKIFRLVLFCLNLLAVIALLLSYLACYISPSEVWILAFFGLAYPVWLAANLFFIVLWLILWNRFIFLSLPAVLLGTTYLLRIIPVNVLNRPLPGGLPLKVLTYNVHSLYGSRVNDVAPEARSQVTDFLAQENSDLVCVQEFYAIGEDYLKTLRKFSHSLGLSNYYFKNYRDFWQRTKINAIATFSRYPITDQGFFRLEDKSTYAVFTDIALGRDTIRVYNVHLESIRFGNDDYSFYSGLTEPGTNEKGFSAGSRRIIWKLRKAFILRSRQVENIRNHIRYCRYPVLICGDFNDTPSSYTYRILSEGRHDAYVMAGNGMIGSTYAGRFPAFRIDYIMYSSFFSIRRYQKKEVDLSDHYPVISEFYIRR